MQKKGVRDVDVNGKRVLMRVDFNVPLKSGAVGDDSRIRASIPTIEYLRERNARIVLCSHLGRPKGQVRPELSLQPVAEHLGKLMRTTVSVLPLPPSEKTMRKTEKMQPGEMTMLENLRFCAAEEANDSQFARELASLADLYVNDAFGAAHRAHASTTGVAGYIPAVAGLLMQKELEMLGRLLASTERPFVAVIGGAKVKDKIGVLKSLLSKVDTLLIGGGMANTMLAASGANMGDSVVEPDRFQDALEIMRLAQDAGVELLLPQDMVVAQQVSQDSAVQVVKGDVPQGWKALDIGPRTRSAFAEKICAARTLFWNGPLGVFEIDAFSEGTTSVALAVAKSSAMSVVGGGDSLAAVQKAGVSDKITHLSTGGGASLEFLEGRVLPGVDILMDRQEARR